MQKVEASISKAKYIATGNWKWGNRSNFLFLALGLVFGQTVNKMEDGN